MPQEWEAADGECNPPKKDQLPSYSRGDSFVKERHKKLRPPEAGKQLFAQIFDTFCETGLRYPAELCLVELVVRALFCHQFVVGSLLENLSVVDHENPVRIFNSRKTVRNDERGTALQQAFDSLLHLNFCLCVDAGRRLVENQNPRIRHHRSGKGEKLALAVGKTGTALADLGVIAVRQLYDKVMGMHGLCGGNDFFLRGIELSIRNVVADRAGEEKVVLCHHAHLGTQAVDGDIRQAVAVDAGPFPK